MRADLHKVFSSSRHRRGRLWSKVKQKGSSKSRPGIYDEDQPHTERIGNRKGLSSRRQKHDVLRRFVRSQVGRPWSEVYADICERLDMRNELQRRVRERLMWYVETNVVLVNGMPWDSRVRYRISDVWVHPDTGILMAPPKPQARYVPTAEQLANRQRAERAKWPRHKVDASHRLVWVEGYDEHPGRWYLVTLKPLPETLEEGEEWPWDVISNWCGPYDWYRSSQFREWGDYVYAVEKRPAPNKLVRRFTNPQPKEESDSHVIRRSPPSV